LLAQELIGAREARGFISLGRVRRALGRESDNKSSNQQLNNRASTPAAPMTKKEKNTDASLQMNVQAISLCQSRD
jgi:hypothetical protein